MHLRLPWILSRKRLISAVALDIIFFIATLHGLQLLGYSTGSTSLSLFICLLIFWLLGSYVSGRFVGGGLKTKYFDVLAYIRDQALASSTIIVLSFLFALIYIWIFNQNLLDVGLCSFLIVFLVLFGITSSFLQYLHLCVCVRKGNDTRELRSQLINHTQECEWVKPRQHIYRPPKPGGM